MITFSILQKNQIAIIEEKFMIKIVYENNGMTGTKPTPLFFWKVNCPDGTCIDGYNSSEIIARRTVNRILKFMYPNNDLHSEDSEEEK